MIKRTKSKDQTQQLMSLSKYVALSGICSRRKATELIEQGRVTVNGEVIVEPGFRVPELALVKALGKLARPEEKIYILLNKPKDYITTVADEKGRKTVMELVQLRQDVRLYPVGRLDRSTTGLLVLTNDGELAQRLSHPRYEVAKTYHVTLDRPMNQVDFKRLGHEGLDLEDGHVNVDTLAFVPGSKNVELLVDLHSGKYRVVRRMFEYLGYRVKKLDRIVYAGIPKTGLRIGHWRFLTPHEVTTLKNAKSSKR